LFKFPDDALKDEGKPRANSIFGIDISHYTGRNFSFDSLKEQNVRFVYAKATQGVRYKDDLFGLYWQALHDLPAEKRVLRGAYHFLSSSADGASQADTFLNVLEKNGGLKDNDMPPVVDLEWDITQSDRSDRWQSHSPDEIIEITLAWLKRVEEKTGRIPVVYTARTWWRERQIPEESFGKLGHYKVWIADYSRSARATETPPTINHSHWDLWQFSETAELSRGYSGSLDANIYKGTEDQFASDFQIAQK
jgi:lysozyme